MQNKSVISAEEAYSLIKQETEDLSWAVCPITYAVYIKSNSLVCKFVIKSEGDKDILELANRVRF